MKKTIIFGVVLLTSLSLTACEDSSTTETKSASSISSSHISATDKSESKKVTQTENKMNPLAHLSAEKLTEYNKGLSNSLIEDQKFAKSGNNNYSWSTYVDSVSYSSRGLIANVNSNFIGLNNTDKLKVGRGLQGLAGAQIVMMNIALDAGAPAVYTNIHYNGRRIGHSKMFKTASFTWSKTSHA